MKMYAHIPALSGWNINSKRSRLVLGAGVVLDWDDHSFEIPKSDGFYPKKHRIGKHLFTISLCLLNWSVSITFYAPKDKI